MKPESLKITDDFAHNDYLQLLAKLGAPGFLIVAAGAFAAIEARPRWDYAGAALVNRSLL